MTQTNPKQWAVELADDWDIECRHCSEYEGDWKADFALAIQAAFAEREARLVGALEKLYRGYVNTLENGRDRITFLGGECDPVERMESGDPVLIEARATLAALKDRTHG